ncbi:MAG TPA: methyltransferase domain-containing protein [Anaeromyxobacteraceae bacterium]|nr:methyltransferase domain-containing protein [Anaeromyxobacteraceae bacterium]
MPAMAQQGVVHGVATGQHPVPRGWSARTSGGPKAMADMTQSAPERFDADPSAYADYLHTPLGRLRSELSWRTLEAHLPRSGPSTPRALDLGGGTGETAVRLAEKGWLVTLVDGSPGMIERAAGLARSRGLGERIACRTLDVDAGGLAQALGEGTYQLVVCHDLLEYVASPEALLREASAALATAGRLSLLVRGLAGEAMKRLLRGVGQETVLGLLATRRVREDLYGLDVRLFDPDEIRGLLSSAGLEVVAERGVRVVADHLGDWAGAGEGAVDRMLELERRLGETKELLAVARYIQTIAERGQGSAAP